MKELLLKLHLSHIPVKARIFLIKALVLFTAWTLLYHLVLLPAKFPDKSLTHTTAISAGILYHYISGHLTLVKDMPDVINTGSLSILYVNNKEAVGIGDLCNGLELYMLYAGFLLCIPEKPLRTFLYIIIGLAGIFVLNIFRIAGIAWLNLHYIAAADFAHHYLFKMIIYALVFYTWVKFSKPYFNA